jgi:hypothetical protein
MKLYALNQALFAFIIGVSLTATLPCLGEAGESQIAADKQVFKNAEKGYRLVFPKSWRVKADPVGIVDAMAAPEETFKQPNPIPNVKIVVKPIPTGHTLDTICDTAVRQWSSIWKVESDKKLELGSLPMRKLVLLQTLNMPTGTDAPVTQQTKVLKAFATSADSYFIISCSDYADNFEKHRELFDGIIDSLVLIKK